MGIKQDFGLRLKELRIKKGITQSQLAEISGIDSKHLSHIETGRSFPKANLIEKFASALDVHYTEFFKTKHLNDRNTILKEIDKILKKADDENLADLYKIILSFMY